MYSMHIFPIELALVSFLLFALSETYSFEPGPIPSHNRICVPTSLLSAKKVVSKKGGNSKRSQPLTFGFGGAAAELCPCGLGESYMKCCGKLHKQGSDWTKATPEQVVRARYSAYAKREIDFIIQSTHPMNPKVVADIQHWREQIDTNCYDNFELTKCQIVEETIVDETTATVCFVANMVQRDSRERTAFQETSTFERVGGAWLYRNGVIAEPPGREPSTAEGIESNPTPNSSV